MGWCGTLAEREQYKDSCEYTLSCVGQGLRIVRREHGVFSGNRCVHYSVNLKIMRCLIFLNWRLEAFGLDL